MYGHDGRHTALSKRLFEVVPRSVGVSPTQAPRGLGVSPKHPWLGQSCPSHHARTRLSVRRGTGFQPVPRRGVGETPTLRTETPKEPLGRATQ
ncbi:MAG: hypothetical protein NZ874_00295 [Fimbriimonadales bacterium]|nr:hypothetical protein [Fimbriimonadales bacterium]